MGETRMWCRERVVAADPAGCLRTLSLRPSLIILFADAPNEGRWNYDVLDPVAEINALCQRRLALQGTPHANAESELDPLAGGRIMYFHPEETLADGAASGASRGLFDTWNIPPWDIWIWYEVRDGQHTLYSWVPPEFVGNANAGMAVNSEGCIGWLDPGELAAWELGDTKVGS